MLAWITRHLFWRSVFALSLAALLLYLVAWIRARAIQKREDALPIANAATAVPQPSVLSAPPERPPSYVTERRVLTLKLD